MAAIDLQPLYAQGTEIPCVSLSIIQDGIRSEMGRVLPITPAIMQQALPGNGGITRPDILALVQSNVLDNGSEQRSAFEKMLDASTNWTQLSRHARQETESLVMVPILRTGEILARATTVRELSVQDDEISYVLQVQAVEPKRERAGEQDVALMTAAIVSYFLDESSVLSAKATHRSKPVHTIILIGERCGEEARTAAIRVLRHRFLCVGKNQTRTH